MKLSTAKYAYLFAGFIVLINAFFLLNVRLLPFIDLPNHLAEATVFKYYAEATNTIGQYYKPVPWYFPNTFHVVFCSLFPSVEFGNKIFFILYIALLLGSVMLTIKELRGNLWFGLLAALFIYNMNVGWGFTGFAIAIPTTILLFYLLLKEVNTQRVIYTISTGIVLVFLFLMHAQMALFGLILTALMMLYRYYNDFKAILLKVVIIPLPLIILLFTWWNNRDAVNEGSTFIYLLDYYKSEFWYEFPKRGKLLFLDNWQLQAGILGVVIGSILTLLAFMPLVIGIIKKEGISKAEFWDAHIYPFIFFFCAFGCFMFLPNRLPGQYPIYERFSPVVLLSLILWGSVWLKDFHFKWLRPYAVAVTVLYSILWFEYIYTFNQINKDFDAGIYKEAGYPSRSAGLIYDFVYRGRPVYIHFPNYFFVWKKGLAASKMIDFRFGVVRRGILGDRIPIYFEWIGADNRFNPKYHQTIEYLLVRGTPAKPESNLSSFILENKKGSWKLYKNNRLFQKAQSDTIGSLHLANYN